MATDDGSAMEHRARDLEQWMRSMPGAYVHPALHIVEDKDRGVHWSTTEDINPDTKLLTTPHICALSYLNALVDDAYPVFKQRREDFTVEAIGFFYLMLQYINKSSSFWKPYLETVPAPSSMLTTPLWFDEEEDKQWLVNTDVEHTMDKRKVVYEQYYVSGKAILDKSGIDTSQFSWDYFRWAITMFTSRSFPSRSVTPQDSKYWTTYKSSPDGRRQTVLLDMSKVSAADRDFSVLFPIIDAGNHDHRVRVHWDYDPGRFSVTTLDPWSAGAEVSNNYGPKANDELFQGYGFCIEGNPYDVVLLTLRPPPADLQEKLKLTHSGYFDQQGAWQADKATFRLGRLNTSSTDASDIFAALPKPLIELLVLTIRHEHGFDDNPASVDLGTLEQRYQPHIARVLATSLAQKLHKLEATTPSLDVTRLKQVCARIYRLSQIEITRSYVLAFQMCLQQSTFGKYSVRLAILEDIKGDTSLLAAPVLQDFLAGIEVNANTSDLQQLRLAGWEDDIWVLLICFAWLSHRLLGQTSLLATLAQAYEHAAPSAEKDLHEQAESLLALVSNAASQLPASIWADSAWSAELIERIGARVYKNESFVLSSAAEQEAKVALCVPTTL